MKTSIRALVPALQGLLGYPAMVALAGIALTSAGTELGSGGTGWSRCARATSGGSPTKGGAPARHS